jgi:hypothetical protein
MKKTIIILIVLAAIFTTCKKEDRDEIFKSRYHRYLTGVWEVNGIKINGIDSTNYLLQNDTLCYRWIFTYDKNRYMFTYYCKGFDYSRGVWELYEKDKKISIIVGKVLSPDSNKVNRWFEKGYWNIIILDKNNMLLKYNSDKIEYEYSFFKYEDD